MIQLKKGIKAIVLTVHLHLKYTLQWQMTTKTTYNDIRIIRPLDNDLLYIIIKNPSSHSYIEIIYSHSYFNFRIWDKKSPYSSINKIQLKLIKESSAKSIQCKRPISQTHI